VLPGGGVSERERDRVGRGWLPPLRTLSSARGLQVEAAKQAYMHNYSVPTLTMSMQLERDRTGVAEVDAKFADARPLQCDEVRRLSTRWPHSPRAEVPPACSLHTVRRQQVSA
jgi:hypothetical protein